jgi:hypothetical protein
VPKYDGILRVKGDDEVITVAPKGHQPFRTVDIRGRLNLAGPKRRAAAQSFCFGLREEMPATAAIMMLAPISASSRTMSGGIPMSSRDQRQQQCCRCGSHYAEK